MISQILSLILFANATVHSAIIQAIIENVSFAAMGFGIWYVVKYNIGPERTVKALVIFFLSGLLVVLIWMGFNFIVENLVERLSNGLFLFERNHLLQFTAGVFIFSIIALSYRLLILFHNYNEKAKSEEKLKTLLTESKLNTLKAYINPHFLFNSLNSVNSLITTNPEEAREMLVNLSEYFRYSLKQKDINFISLEDEMHYTQTYFEIEKLRFGDKIETKIDIDENAGKYSIPVMILQPLFENVIKHAVSESLFTINLSFSAKLIDKSLVITMTNNYDEESISKRGTGIGLSATAERLHLLYGTKNLLTYTKKDSIFKVVLEIPYQKENL